MKISDPKHNDLFWSLETLTEAKLTAGGLTLTPLHVEEMLAVTKLVFEILERVWTTLNHSVIDMKIEFGVTINEEGRKQIVVADFIDNDSWRLWPNGDKRLMLDKQIYRNMDISKIDDAAIAQVKSRFELVAERAQALFGSMLPKIRREESSNLKNRPPPEVAVIISSLGDIEHANEIKNCLIYKYGVSDVDIYICSAHKTTKHTLKIIDEIMQWPSCQVIIACASRSNSLGPCLAGNTTVPVINCPPFVENTSLELDVMSSLRLPGAIGCTTIIGAENAALAAANIISNLSPFTWAKIRTLQCYTVVNMLYADSVLRS